MTLEDRIVRLERQNRWMKRAAVAAIGLFVTLGQAKPSDTIRARAFVLVDEAGKGLGALAIRDDGYPSLMLSGDDGAAVIEFSKGGPRLVLTDGTRLVSLATRVGELGPGGGQSRGVVSSEAAVESAVGLRIKSEDGTAEVMVTPAGSAVLLKTQPGPEQMKAWLGVTKSAAVFLATSKHGRVHLLTGGDDGPLFVLSGPDEKTLFKAP